MSYFLKLSIRDHARFLYFVLFSIKIGEKLSAKQKMKSNQSQSLQSLCFCLKSGQLLKDFSTKSKSLFHFLL